MRRRAARHLAASAAGMVLLTAYTMCRALLLAVPFAIFVAAVVSFCVATAAADGKPIDKKRWQASAATLSWSPSQVAWSWRLIYWVLPAVFVVAMCVSVVRH